MIEEKYQKLKRVSSSACKKIHEAIGLSEADGQSMSISLNRIKERLKRKQDAINNALSAYPSAALMRGYLQPESARTTTRPPHLQSESVTTDNIEDFELVEGSRGMRQSMKRLSSKNRHAFELGQLHRAGRLFDKAMSKIKKTGKSDAGDKEIERVKQVSANAAEAGKSIGKTRRTIELRQQAFAHGALSGTTKSKTPRQHNIRKAIEWQKQRNAQ